MKTANHGQESTTRDPVGRKVYDRGEEQRFEPAPDGLLIRTDRLAQRAAERKQRDHNHVCDRS